MANGKVGWRCSCDCGSTIIIPGFELKSGNKSSCGCLRGDITGKRFGRLIAIKRHSYDAKNRRQSWLCKCDCGAERVVWNRNLYKNQTTACKDCSDENRRLANLKRRLSPLDRAIHQKYAEYRGNAVAKNRIFDLSMEDAGQLFQGNCYYCGVPSSIERLNGIDRANNDSGYTAENSLPCCAKCNYLKNKWSKDDLLAWARNVAKRHP